MDKDETIAKLQEEVDRLRTALDRTIKNTNKIASMKMRESRDEIQNMYATFTDSMNDSMQIMRMPLVVDQLVIPISRHFMDWEVGFSVHNKKGVAYINVAQPVDEYDIGFIVWNDCPDTKTRYIQCVVDDDFRYPGWASDTLLVPEERLFETLESLHNNLRTFALDYLKSLPPEEDGKSSPDFTNLEHHGC